MIPAIVKQLKTGTIKNVVQFGVSKLPAIPYIVVKPESRNGVRAIRIIVHMMPTAMCDLEDYLFINIPTLLNNFKFTDRKGCVNSIYTEGEYTDIITGNDDGSIAMEMVFLAPQKLST